MTPTPLLRFALRLDGVASASVGLLACLGLGAVGNALGAPRAAVLAAGLFSLGYGVFAFWLGSRPRVRTTGVWAIVVGNLLWAAASVALGFSGWIAPTAVGLALLLAQAAAVALFAELQFLGLRQSRALAAA